MIIDRLLDLRRQLPPDAVVPEGHKAQRIRWILELNADGGFAGLVDTGTRKQDAAVEVAPYVKRTSATVPLLLVDKLDYVLGYSDDETSAERATERHRAYTELLERATEATGDATVGAVVRGLRRSDTREAAEKTLREARLGAGDLVAPRVEGRFPHRNPAVQRFWQERLAADATERSEFEAVCMGCGEHRPIARTHPVELQLAGNNVGLVTGNAPAFLSHGLDQSEIAPLCHHCARGYGEALGFLLESREHRLYVGGGSTWLFWTRDGTDGDFPLARLFTDPQPNDVRRLLQSAQRGHLAETKITDAFYALVVSANKSRLVVRNWLAEPLPRVHAHLATYFQRQRMIDRRGESPPLKLLALAGATVRDLKDLPPQTPDTLLTYAIAGRPLPTGLLYQALRRAHADDTPVTRARAALIRLVLLSQPQPVMAEEHLTRNHPDPAYHCGRLLAVLDDIQRTATGVTATLVDRFYGSASTTPASVLGVLIGKAQPHLAKLRKNQKGLYHYFEQQLTEIASQIPANGGFPRTLSPEQQGLFALGFYQQKHRPKKPAEAPDSESEVEA